jgi:hypothetical protein
VNRFLKTGRVSKGKSPISDEIVEDLRERVEETPQISVAYLSQQSGVLCILLNKFKIFFEKSTKPISPEKPSLGPVYY